MGAATGGRPGFAGGSSVGGGHFSGVPAVSGGRSFSPGNMSSRASSQNFGPTMAARGNIVPQNVARVNNLWTEQTTAPATRQRVSPQTGTSVAQYRSSPYYQDNAGAIAAGSQAGLGTRLYSGSYGSNLADYNGVRSVPGGTDKAARSSGERFHRSRGRHIYYPYYGYGYNFYPYAGDYIAGDAGVYPSYGTSDGLNAEASLTPDLSTYDGGSQPSPQQDGGGNPSAVVPPGAAQVDAPYGGAPAPWVGQQQAPRPAASRGPDSLVEAVQSELSTRGYFKGKVDAMFNDDTKEAVRQFQKDNQLATTGLINNATLTMLGLN